MLAPVPERPRPMIGVSVDGGPKNTADVDGFRDAIGGDVTMIGNFQALRDSFDVSQADAAYAAGAFPLLTIEPWVPGDGVNQPDYQLRDITAGAHDAALIRWAIDLANYEHPILLRFAHEMNGSWYPWAVGANGNATEDFGPAYRHVYQVFSFFGADNVTWVWSPNVYFGTNPVPLGHLYPGHDFVDIVGLDGYNGGDISGWPGWRSFSQVFDHALRDIEAIAPSKSILIAETASSNAGGSKSAWIDQMFDAMEAHRNVLGLVWFEHDKETDWRIQADPASAKTFARRLAGFRQR